MTWDEAKINSDKLTNAIEKALQKEYPMHIIDVIKVVTKIDNETIAIPNPNQNGLYCQLILYPSKKWETWSSTSMSISHYNIYR